MDIRKKIPITTRSLTFLGIGAGIVLILIYIGFLNHRAMANLDREIVELNIKINTHKNFAPMTTQLFERMKVKTLRALPLPQRAKLSGEQKDRIAPLFRDMAQKSNMELLSVNPDINSMVGGSTGMLVHATLKGDYINFRTFLIELGGQAFLERIEEMDVLQLPGSKEFRLKVWLAVG